MDESPASKKILLFGGSFDPPHLGHTELLRAAAARLRPDRVYIVPAFHSPLKAAPRTSVEDRLRMVKAMAASLGPLERITRIDTFELDRHRQTFTYQVLRYFRTRYPAEELWFLLGGDSLAQFDRWKRPQELRTACGWIVGVRHGVREAPINLPRLLQLPGRLPPWSSTDVRSRILAGLDVRKMLLPSIKAYIWRRKLYGINAHIELKKALSKDRYEHTLGVARLAHSLAVRNGVDPESAACAGLLHDSGRRFDLAGMARYVRQHNLQIPYREAVIEKAPILLHAFISADLARRRFGIEDRRILSAIQNHTLGTAGMPPLDRLVYVADIASEDRGFPEAKKIRTIAAKTIDRALREAVKTKIRHIRANGQWLHPTTGKFLTWAQRLNRP